MIDTNEPGLYLVEGDGEVVEIHTSSQSDDNPERLKEYMDEWDLD